MSYALVIHDAEEGGYWAEVPALPGCFVQGETIEEVLAEAPDAIESHIEALRADGQPVPHDGRVLIATVGTRVASVAKRPLGRRDRRRERSAAPRGPRRAVGQDHAGQNRRPAK